MRRTVVLLAVVFLGLSVTTDAGVEPTPFHVEINQLESIGNNFKNLTRQLDRILAHPPDADPPHGDLNGALGKLSAMDLLEVPQVSTKLCPKKVPEKGALPEKGATLFVSGISSCSLRKGWHLCLPVNLLRSPLPPR